MVHFTIQIDIFFLLCLYIYVYINITYIWYLKSNKHLQLLIEWCTHTVYINVYNKIYEFNIVLLIIIICIILLEFKYTNRGMFKNNVVYVYVST